MSTNDGGPATPIIVVSGDVDQRNLRDMLGKIGNVGLTVRDAYAIGIMQGILAKGGGETNGIVQRTFALADLAMIERLK